MYSDFCSARIIRQLRYFYGSYSPCEGIVTTLCCSTSQCTRASALLDIVNVECVERLIEHDTKPFNPSSCIMDEVSRVA